MMELRIFFAQINLAFFFERLDDDLNNYSTIETFLSYPSHGYIKPVPWGSMSEKR
jgi:hypothetical protein